VSWLSCWRSALPYACAFFLFLFAQGSCYGEVARDFEFRGISRTDPDWLKHYLGLALPADLANADLERIRTKLLTTDVFLRVDVRLADGRLVIDVEEKWTTIPVVRGAYGGGTPLLVAGVYETHALGRLVTLGAETKKYGSAPAGFTLWAKLPRAGQGRSSAGIELWRDFRRRTFYDAAGNETGVLGFDSSFVRAQHLFSLIDSITGPLDPLILQAGFEFLSRRDGRPSIEGSPLTGIDLPAGDASSENRLLLSAVFDNMAVEDQLLDGVRASLKWGVSRSAGVENPGDSRYAEVEGFAFLRPVQTFNMAAHAYMQSAGAPTISNVFHLGGFDSVRGFPDGIRQGPFAAYGNLELRSEVFTSRAVKLAGVLFTDAGIAGDDFADAKKDVFRSAGAGVRIAIPKVHRLVFRIDYGWGRSNEIRTSGVSLGLNQFFQPYKPL
jgi:hypothetical protein